MHPRFSGRGRGGITSGWPSVMKDLILRRFDATGPTTATIAFAANPCTLRLVFSASRLFAPRLADETQLGLAARIVSRPAHVQDVVAF